MITLDLKVSRFGEGVSTSKGNEFGFRHSEFEVSEKKCKASSSICLLNLSSTIRTKDNVKIHMGGPCSHVLGRVRLGARLGGSNNSRAPELVFRRAPTFDGQITGLKLGTCKVQRMQWVENLQNSRLRGYYCGVEGHVR